jgi:molybdopterin/thiamine biosynthesis adenylyltransferase
MNEIQRQRYARQLSLEEIGEAGQDVLAASRVLVVGVGGLGSPVALYLAAAGVGALGLVDADRVEIGNLQRQILHATADIGRPKVESAADRLRELNPDLHIEIHPFRLTADRATGLVARYDFVVEATDNFESKFVVSDACRAAGRACSHAGIHRFLGQTLTVRPGRTACFRCLFDPPPPGPPEPPAGPLGAVAGILGCIQAAEAVKCLLGIGQTLEGRLMVVDVLRMTTRVVPVARRSDCRCSGSGGAGP